MNTEVGETGAQVDGAPGRGTPRGESMAPMDDPAGEAGTIGRRPQAIVVMGTAGSGKTTVAALLAGRLGAAFAEGDDFHSPENVAKMAAGHPLNDEDRRPWLREIRDWLAGELKAGRTAVVPCSALRREYRDILRTASQAADGDDVRFVHLTGSYALLRERIQGRAGHFMKPAMLDSQLATLEPLQDDEPGFSVDVTPRPAEIVGAIQRRLREAEDR